MGIKSLLKKQFATVIEWAPQSSEHLFWQYPALTDEIKNTSKLLVAPGQGCILVYRGEITEVLRQEGTYPLKTSNHPFVTSLLKFWQSFESEHKLRLYFYRKAEVVNQGWGTATPVKYVDPEYEFPVELSAYGNFSYKIRTPETLFATLVGSAAQLTTQDFKEWLDSRIMESIRGVLSGAHVPFTQIDAKLPELNVKIQAQLRARAASLGVEMTDFQIEGTTFDAQTLARVGQVSDMTAADKAAKEVGLNYEEVERLKALRDAAKNEGGIAGIGAGIAAGASIGKDFSASMDAAAGRSDASAPRRAHSDHDVSEQLRTLKALFDEGILSDEEYDAKKKDLLARL